MFGIYMAFPSEVCPTKLARCAALVKNMLYNELFGHFNGVVHINFHEAHANSCVWKKGQSLQSISSQNTACPVWRRQGEQPHSDQRLHYENPLFADCKTCAQTKKFL